MYQEKNLKSWGEIWPSAGTICGSLGTRRNPSIWIWSYRKLSVFTADYKFYHPGQDNPNLIH